MVIAIEPDAYFGRGCAYLLGSDGALVEHGFLLTLQGGVELHGALRESAA